MKKMYLDDEERDLVESIERGEWRSVKNLKEEIKKHQEYAPCGQEPPVGNSSESTPVHVSPSPPRFP